MKTFEEKFTAWVDGRLTGPDLAAYEVELQSHPEALGEKEECLKLGALLRTHVTAPPLQNADFFNHQLLQQIASSESAAAKSAPARRTSFWSLSRMALSGAFLLLLSALLFFAAVPQTRRQVHQSQQYVQNVLNARSDDPAITATSFHSKQDNVNVVWLDGLGYMPPAHKLK